MHPDKTVIVMMGSSVRASDRRYRPGGPCDASAKTGAARGAGRLCGEDADEQRQPGVKGWVEVAIIQPSRYHIQGLSLGYPVQTIYRLNFIEHGEIIRPD